ncbi:putative RNA-binding protein [Smittium mucronatum]|uniref:Putative RNA-binding protein n=1 Tax=Smittium mucronatum TaxID=133383 RepID=A0A1R0GY51_9FUNG|nr:putative RNA-binding protein [Smittium mucronatum]
MALFEDEDSAILKGYLMGVLQKLSDADPNILAEYVMVLLQHDKKRDEIYEICKTDLKDFLGDETNGFVENLFYSLKYKTYIQKQSRKQEPQVARSKKSFDRYVSKSPKSDRYNRDLSDSNSRNRRRDRNDQYDNKKEKRKRKNSYNGSQIDENSKSSIKYDDNMSKRRETQTSHFKKEDSGSEIDLKKRYDSKRFSNSKTLKTNSNYSSLDVNSSDEFIKRESSDDNPEMDNDHQIDINQNDEPYDPEDAVIKSSDSSIPPLNFDKSYLNQDQHHGYRPQIMNPGLVSIPSIYGVNINMPMGLRMGMGIPINPGLGGARPPHHLFHGNMIRPLPHLQSMNPINPGPIGFGHSNNNARNNFKINSNRPHYDFNQNKGRDAKHNDQGNLDDNKDLNDIGFVPDTQFVVENIPVEHLNRFSVENYFSQFGKLVQVQVDIDSRSALLIFADKECGLKAYRSQDAILSNRFITIRKRKRSQFSQKLHQNSQQEELANEDIRNKYLEKQKAIAEVNEKKTKLVDMYMNQQKILMSKLMDPLVSSKLTKPAIEEIKANIKKIQVLVKEVLNDGSIIPSEAKVESSKENAGLVDQINNSIRRDSLENNYGKVTGYNFNPEEGTVEVSYSQRWEAEEAFKSLPALPGFENSVLNWEENGIELNNDSGIETGLDSKEEASNEILSNAFGDVLEPGLTDGFGFDGFDYHENTNNHGEDRPWDL